MRSSILIVFSYFIHSFTIYAQQETEPVTIETDIYHYAQEVLAGQNILEIKNFTGTHSQRDVIEFILVQQALALGGSNINFTFTLGNYDARNLKLLQSGLLLISFDSMWLSQISPAHEDVYISDPIIRKGEFWAGLYTATTNEKALATRDLTSFQRLSVISNKNWLVDWKTLTQMSPKHLTHEEEWLSMAKLVNMGWVDIMLAPFTPQEPFSYQGGDYHIVAIDGIKIALNDSRHFVVSKKHPRGKETFEALQKGLKILRKRGTIIKVFKQSGFFNKKVQGWHTINNKQILSNNSDSSDKIH